MVVDYAAKKVPRLPDIQASSFVVADASTGQVLAGKDPHGYYRPASTLKMLTAATLVPLLNPNSAVVASKLATTTVAERGRPGHRAGLPDLRSVHRAADHLGQ